MTSLGRFRGDEYRRLWQATRKSLERSGGVASGTVSIGEPTEAERTAVIGLTGTHRKADAARLTIRLPDLDDAVLRTTGLHLVGLIVVLSGPLRNRPAERDALEVSRASLVAGLRASVLHERHEWYRTWLVSLETSGVITRAVKQGDGDRLLLAARALELLDVRSDDSVLPLPAFAEQVTSDTKALNRGRSLATLVLAALAGRFDVPKARTAEEVRQLWESAGIIVDDLASRVLVLNVPASGPGLGEWLSGAAAFGTPFQVTLHQLINHPIQVSLPEVFACENPAVLRRAAEELGSRSRPLICAEGQPSAAFHRLARVIRGGGGRLYYHGDFDWPGVAIAEQIIGRHYAEPWRMGMEDYLRGSRADGDRFPLSGGSRLTPWDDRLSQAMTAAGAAVYEEAVADTLLEDLRSSS